MTATAPQASINEVGPDIYRISIAMPPCIIPGGFSFNQYLVVDQRPLLFHTGHLPHGWECGYLFDQTTRTLFCGDLFTQPGTGDRPLVSDDILEPSEALRHQMDSFSHSRNAPPLIDKLANLRPELLACMHGSAWAGDGAALLRQLGRSLAN